MNKTEHLLTCLMEECAEIQQAAAKALRFGLQDGYPGTDRTNEQDICKEIADLIGVINLLAEEKVLPIDDDSNIDYAFTEAINAKKERVREYMEYAKTTGALAS